MNKNSILLILILPALLGAAPARPELELKPVTFTILDEADNPVENALIEASLHGPGNAEGYTGPDGKATLQLNKGASLHVYVSKDGYYQTGGELWIGGLYKGSQGRLVAKELPDAFTIQLKQIGEPVFLIHHQIRGRAPRTGEPAGFDLEKGDWVSPFGSGETPDLMFHFKDIENKAAAYSGNMEISFPNPDDGIQGFKAARPYSMEFGSNLAQPSRAPIDGYEPHLIRRISHREGEAYEAYQPDRQNYLVRSRTRRDAAGRIVQACYAWISGEIQFDTRDPRGPQLAFSYYFNPDPDPEARSLEYEQGVP